MNRNDIKDIIIKTARGFGIVVCIVLLIAIVGKVVCAIAFQDMCYYWDKSYIFIGFFSTAGIWLCHAIGDIDW